MTDKDETNITRPMDDAGEIADRWRRIKQIFEKATGLVGSDRQQYLRDECGDDAQLIREIDRLLSSFEDAESFLENPAVADAESLFEDKSTLVSDRLTGDGGDLPFVAGTVLASRYRIVTLIGKGGMGEVYKAEDIKLSQTVALKFVPDRLERDRFALERFISEVRIARQVSHPNVCRVFDIGEINGRHYLSMEFIDGDDLSSLLRRVGRLPAERAIEIGRQLCVGLSAIHNAGILHRDFKPANVIIDSRGKARITDFGIAGLTGEIENDSLRVGTPAYMSPEQIRGRDVSFRSDIYALGLVLYEIFTGKQAFSADSIPELIRKHQTETPTNPSEHVKGIDPLVESVIGQCLSKNPDDRPPSALHVAMSLPGGNPMQIALDAGQTPSPEMVAASPKKGALKPMVAFSLVIGGAAMLAFSMFAAMRVAVNNRVPLNKSAEVLSDRANEITARFGYTEMPAEEWYRFYDDSSYAESVRDAHSEEKWKIIESGQPLMFVFVKRQNPRYFDVVMKGNGLWTNGEPAVNGERSISLDTRGRLVEFSAVPPQFAPANESKTDFLPAFQAAELNPALFREVLPSWTPPRGFDERNAWEGVMPDHAEIPLRVEAAGFQGRIVFFKLIYPWTKPDLRPDDSYSKRDWIGMFIFAGVLLGVVLTAVLLAWKNVRSGSGDRKGAFKTALFVFCLTFCGWVLSTNRVPSFFPELERVMLASREALRISAIIWVLYLALEPVIRRHLPDLMVSWNRLQTGDWRDSLVGRNVLIGTVWGIGHVTLIYAGFYAESVVNGSFRLFSAAGGLLALRSWLAGILGSAALGVSYGFMATCFLAIVFLAVRRRLWAGLVIFAVMSTVEILFFTESLVYLPFTITISSIWSLAITRAGLTTTVVAQTVFLWLASTLLTLNPSAWYADRMFLTLGAIAVLLIYGVRTSLAGRAFAPNIGSEA